MPKFDVIPKGRMGFNY